ncbi:hypothetical protein AGMMS49574_18410 [Bacteroidia bacterium]|nr:hypothetical protein AGMMS49574_18410 [Bacteroidia bacterium]
MDNEIKTWLYDILTAIQEIESFFLDRPKRFADYRSDLRTKRAVERNIEIIGEAMNRILKHDETITITNSRKIVDVRNRIFMDMIPYRTRQYGVLLLTIFHS